VLPGEVALVELGALPERCEVSPVSEAMGDAEDADVPLDDPELVDMAPDRVWLI
jgi:hypothetical protein